MSTAQLRNSAIDKIYSIEDEKFLKAINVILDTQTSSAFVYKLSKKLKKDIQKSQAQIARREFISNEDLEKEEDKWLTNKLVL